MYSDEQIRQAILEMVDGEWTRNLVQRTKDLRFLPVALEMLKGSDDKDINAALNILFYAKEVHVSIALSEILPFLDNPLHCANAIRLIGRIGDASLFPRLIAFLSYPHAEARYRSLATLHELKHPQIFEISLHLINDADATVRYVACLVLGELRNPLAVEALIGKLNDAAMSERGAVNFAAAHALGSFRDKRAVEPMKRVVIYGNAEVSAFALRALWILEGASLEEFYAEQLQHPFEETRQEAIRNLAQIGNPVHLHSLIFISQNDASYDVQLAAAAALFKLGTEKALEAAAYWEKHFRRNDES